MSFGSFADWVAAVAAIGALVVAVLAFRAASSSQRAGEIRHRRADMEKVLAWVACVVPDPNEKPESYGVVVHNGSTGVITDIVLDLWFFATTRRITINSLPPGEFYVQSVRSGNQNSWAFPMSTSSIAGEIRPITKTGADKKTEITSLSFNSAAGSAWSRTGGTLTERTGD